MALHLSHLLESKWVQWRTLRAFISYCFMLIYNMLEAHFQSGYQPGLLPKDKMIARDVIGTTGTPSSFSKLVKSQFQLAGRVAGSGACPTQVAPSCNKRQVCGPRRVVVTLYQSFQGPAVTLGSVRRVSRLFEGVSRIGLQRNQGQLMHTHTNQPPEGTHPKSCSWKHQCSPPFS